MFFPLSPNILTFCSQIRGNRRDRKHLKGRILDAGSRFVTFLKLEESRANDCIKLVDGVCRSEVNTNQGVASFMKSCYAFKNFTSWGDKQLCYYSSEQIVNVAHPMCAIEPMAR